MSNNYYLVFSTYPKSLSSDPNDLNDRRIEAMESFETWEEAYNELQELRAYAQEERDKMHERGEGFGSRFTLYVKHEIFRGSFSHSADGPLTCVYSLGVEEKDNKTEYKEWFAEGYQPQKEEV